MPNTNDATLYPQIGVSTCVPSHSPLLLGDSTCYHNGWLDGATSKSTGQTGKVGWERKRGIVR